MRAVKSDEKRENTDLPRSRLTPSRIRMAGTDDGHPENIYPRFVGPALTPHDGTASLGRMEKAVHF